MKDDQKQGLVSDLLLIASGWVRWSELALMIDDASKGPQITFS